MPRKRVQLPTTVTIKANKAQVLALRYESVAGIPCIVVRDADGQERSYMESALLLPRAT